MVYKANMIIPQISENLTQSASLEVPEVCPRCGAQTEEVQNHEAKVLICTNPACPAKLHRAFVHFTSRGAMNIEGLSEATLDRFIDAGFWENTRIFTDCKAIGTQSARWTASVRSRRIRF